MENSLMPCGNIEAGSGSWEYIFGAPLVAVDELEQCP